MILCGIKLHEKIQNTPLHSKRRKYSFPSLFDDLLVLKWNGGPTEKEGNS
jgi:hypothetical protein